MAVQDMGYNIELLAPEQIQDVKAMQNSIINRIEEESQIVI